MCVWGGDEGGVGGKRVTRRREETLLKVVSEEVEKCKRPNLNPFYDRRKKF